MEVSEECVICGQPIGTSPKATLSEKGSACINKASKERNESAHCTPGLQDCTMELPVSIPGGVSTTRVVVGRGVHMVEVVSGAPPMVVKMDIYPLTDTLKASCSLVGVNKIHEDP